MKFTPEEVKSFNNKIVETHQRLRDNEVGDSNIILEIMELDEQLVKYNVIIIEYNQITEKFTELINELNQKIELELDPKEKEKFKKNIDKINIELGLADAYTLITKDKIKNLKNELAKLNEKLNKSQQILN